MQAKLPDHNQRLAATCRLLGALSGTPHPFPRDAQAVREAGEALARAEAKVRVRSTVVAQHEHNLRVMGVVLENAIEALGLALARPGENAGLAMARFGISRQAFRDKSPKEVLRYPWLAASLLHRVECKPGQPTRINHFAIQTLIEGVRVAADAVNACGRSYRKALAEKRAAAAKLEDMQEDWEISYLALKRRSRAVPGLFLKLFGK